jgi:hypothetical protein
VLFEIRRASLCDDDNSVGGVKACLDCLRDAGLIPQDSPQDITLEVVQKKAASKLSQGMKIKITYPDGGWLPPTNPAP